MILVKFRLIWLLLLVVYLTRLCEGAGSYSEAVLETEEVYAEVNFISDSINELNEKGETYLTSAASAGSYAVVKNYIKAGADVNKTNIKGNTPLMAAAERGRYLTSVELIKAHTDVNVRNAAGMTALLYAIAGNHVDIAIAILNTGASSVDDTLPNGRLNGVMITAQNNHWETLEELIKRGSKLNTQSATGETALMYAAVTGSVNASRLLINAGANLNLQNKNGLTALMFASSRGFEDIGRLLLESKCDWTMQDSVRMTAYDYAFESNKDNVMKLLQSYGAKRSRRKI